MWPTDTDPKLDEFGNMELPGQQIPATNALTPLDHVLNLDIHAAPGVLRLTGIAATVGRNSYDLHTLEKLIGNGMNIAIINTNFGTSEEHVDAIRLLRQAAKNYSSRMGRNYPLAIALRLSGRKLRIGRIAQMYGETVELKAGEVLRLTTDETYKDRCSMYTVYVDFQSFAEQMKRNDKVLLDNELIALKVEIISANTVTCRIERGGTLGSYKDVFVPNKMFRMPTINEKDKADLELGIKNQVDIVIGTLIASASMVDEIRKCLGEKGKRISIVSNVCTIEGYRKFDEILQASDGVMITRQELGTDIQPKKLVIAQKNMIARANKANVPVLVCAHVFSSMRFNQLALRSEQLDVANMVLDGVDVVVLSAETSIGLYPIESIVALNHACKEAEACIWSKQLFHDFISTSPIPCDQMTGTAIGAVLASYRSIAAAIVVVTTTGKSAQIVSQFKPRCPIMAVTRYAHIARKMHLWRGVLPLHYEASPDADWTVDVEKRVSFATKWGVEQGFIRIGDPVVIVCGWRQGSGFTNTMRIVYVQQETV